MLIPVGDKCSRRGWDGGTGMSTALAALSGVKWQALMEQVTGDMPPLCSSMSK